MSSPQRILIAAFSVLAVALGACTKKKSEAEVVNLAIWGNYLSPESRQKFESTTGIKINVTNYSSNEELFAKVQTGASGFDVAVPSDYMVEIMIKERYLEPLDRAQIPNAAGLSPDMLSQGYDPQNGFSLPYAWTTAGIAVNRDLYKGKMDSWKDFFENPALAGKISLLDDVREVTAAVLKMQGSSVNTTDKVQLAKAKEALLKIRKNVKMFNSDTIDLLKNKEVVAAHAYSPDALKAKDAGANIEYVLPKEGATRAIDNVVIVKGAPHVKNAHALINFLYSSEANLAFVKEIKAGPVLKDTKEKLPPDMQANKGLFPAPETMARLERISDLGEENRLYEDIWTAVKTAR